MEEMKKKGKFDLIDLHDKNESKSEDMIDILSDMHNYFVPSARSSDQVIPRVVFGGDVLANERAYQAQLEMISGWSGGAMVLGKLPALGRPTDLDYSRARLVGWLVVLGLTAL